MILIKSARIQCTGTPITPECLVLNSMKSRNGVDGIAVTSSSEEIVGYCEFLRQKFFRYKRQPVLARTHSNVTLGLEPNADLDSQLCGPPQHILLPQEPQAN